MSPPRTRGQLLPGRGQRKPSSKPQAAPYCSVLETLLPGSRARVLDGAPCLADGLWEAPGCQNRQTGGGRSSLSTARGSTVAKDFWCEVSTLLAASRTRRQPAPAFHSCAQATMSLTNAPPGPGLRLKPHHPMQVVPQGRDKLACGRGSAPGLCCLEAWSSVRADGTYVMETPALNHTGPKAPAR